MNTLLEKIMSNIQISDSNCWEWQGEIIKGGYGRCHFKGNKYIVHRAMLISLGKEIPEGFEVCHSCDNPRCCNPEHLFIGTHKQNIKDRDNKGRTAKGDSHYARTSPEKLARGEKSGSILHPESRPRGKNHWSVLHPEKRAIGERHGSHTKPERVAKGERSGSAKLSQENVIEIRNLYKSGYKQVELAKMFNVTKGTINHIIKGRNWKND